MPLFHTSRLRKQTQGKAHTAFTAAVAMTVLVSCAPKSGDVKPACAAPAQTPKVDLGHSVSTNSVDSSRSSLAAGTRVVVDVRDVCPAPGPIVSQLPDRQDGVTKAGVRSYTWALPRVMSVQELEALADSDDCVSRVSESQDIELGGLPVSTTEAMNLDSSPQTMPNDPGAKLETHLAAIGASSAYDIFFNAKTGIKKDVVIAIIDTGVRIDHEDLRGNLWVNKNEIPNNGIDDDRNGYIDDVYGYNFVSHIGNPQPQRTAANAAWIWAHGTRVAGLAAARGDNGKGGLGADYRAKIMSLNNLGPGSSMDQGVTANAIRYAADNGADVINMSLGGNSGQITAYRDAIRYAVSKGVVVLAAAGNESMQIGSAYSAAGMAPSIGGLISVGNFQALNYNKDTTSNYSQTYVELGAPGINTMSSQLYTTSPESTTSYSYFAGTSAATPVASGAAALAIGLIKSRGYTYTPADIENLLLTSARKVSTLRYYFKDGNALDLASLARLVDARYPARGVSQGDSPIATGGETQLTPAPETCSGT